MHEDNPEAIVKTCMSVDDFARSQNCGRSLVYAEIKRGKLIARKMGKRTIILPEDAEAYRRNLPKLIPA